eukprot:CAMPEP_0182436574 /NCGR_PEP_ID=MMETSP1167-20130531/82325_1 /TAXON_ID=2988 /ORGANISM="Mallomonas Sp, Strain CCMP3275" /LENGTH=155 /DNA_ID=CAMNT_0024628893 /DNA_START=192 /DNA_END=655 /DNA_ORIENTATION=-
MTSMIVRLHHPATSLQIGETLIAHNKDKDVMSFELQQSPGRSIRIDGKGRVEFSMLSDEATLFLSETNLSGTIYLKCKAHQKKMNSMGGLGWYLALSKDGRLHGNAGRAQTSLWFVHPVEEELKRPRSTPNKSRHNSAPSSLSSSFSSPSLSSPS